MQASIEVAPWIFLISKMLLLMLVMMISRWAYLYCRACHPSSCKMALMWVILMVMWVLVILFLIMPFSFLMEWAGNNAPISELGEWSTSLSVNMHKQYYDPHNISYEDLMYSAYFPHNIQLSFKVQFQVAYWGLDHPCYNTAFQSCHYPFLTGSDLLVWRYTTSFVILLLIILLLSWLFKD